MSAKLLKSTFVVSAMTLLSRITGLVRDMLFAHVMGSGLVADAFFVAFRIPNFLRRIFGEGAFSVAFVPVFSEYRATRSNHETRAFLDMMAGRLGLVLAALTLVGVVAAPAIVTAIAPGFLREAEKFDITVDALRITFPYLFFISLVAMAGGILNGCGRFAVPAATPVLLNLCLIAAAVGLVPVMPNAAVALAAGVLVAGLAQLAFQLPFLKREGLLPRPQLRKTAPAHEAGGEGSARVFRLMLPAVFGTSVAQINLLVNTLLASFLVTGSVSWLYYSDRLMEFPLGVFGVALATVILPNLSEKHAVASMEEFSNLLDWAMRWVFVVVIPATVALMVLAGPLLATLFQYGAFTGHDVVMASRSLVAFALGLIGFVLVKVLANGFYARQDTKTPVRIAVVAMVVNILLSLALVYFLDHVALALAPSIAAFVNAALLYRRLRSERVYRPIAGWGGFLARVLASSLLMGVVLWWGTGAVETWIDAGAVDRVLRLCLWMGAGMAVYFSCILALGLRPGQLSLRSR